MDPDLWRCIIFQSKMSKLANTIFFFQKKNISLIYFLVHSIIQNFQNILRVDPDLWQCIIFGPNMVNLPWTRFFWKTLVTYLQSTSWPFSLCTVLKKYLEWIQTYDDASFLGPKFPNWHKQEFFQKINIIRIYLLVPFIIQNFQKIFKKWSKWLIGRNKDFFQKM